MKLIKKRERYQSVLIVHFEPVSLLPNRSASILNSLTNKISIMVSTMITIVINEYAPHYYYIL